MEFIFFKVENNAANEIEYQKMKDEVDELRLKAVEAKKFESNLEMYKRKLGNGKKCFFDRICFIRRFINFPDECLIHMVFFAQTNSVI